nr:hypothetical protein [Tanacetum cinerariifolium]
MCIENVADDPEGDIRFLEELLIDDFILSHESFDSNFEDSPLIPRPPPELPDDNFDLEPEELLIDDSILSHESSDSNFEDSPSISRPPPEPPDDNFDLEPEVISALIEVIDEPDEHFNPGREIFVSIKIEDDDYFSFMFVIRTFLPYLLLPEILSFIPLRRE